jgi:hypothetical protein
MNVNWFGFIIAIITFLLIGFGFLWVILLERYLGYRWAPVVIVLGIVLMAASVFIQGNLLSAGMDIFGGILIWGAHELKDQAKRSRLGWFKNNDKKIQPPW